jgi:hypothetical protein
VLLACYWLAGAESLAKLLAMMLFYVSFGFMVISTMEMLHKDREFRHFRVWSQLFLSHSARYVHFGLHRKLLSNIIVELKVNGLFGSHASK